MYLIQIKDNCFIDADKINSISVHRGKLYIGVAGVEEPFTVDDKYIDSVLNQIQAMNGNFMCQLDHLHV